MSLPMNASNKQTQSTAAKVIAEILGDPTIEVEVRQNLVRRSKIDALVSERAKANLTMRDIARRMGVSVNIVRKIENDLDDSQIPSSWFRAYTAAVRKGGLKKRGSTKGNRNNGMGLKSAVAKLVPWWKDLKRGYPELANTSFEDEFNRIMSQMRKRTRAEVD